MSGESMEDVASRRRMRSRRMASGQKPAEDDAVDAAVGAPDRVIVVLGYHEIGDDGRHGISSICRAAVRRAEALAARRRRRGR